MIIGRRAALLGSIALGLSQRAAAQTAADFGPTPPAWPRPSEMITLWPDGAPGMPAQPPVEEVIERSADPLISDRAIMRITRPRMAVFHPRQPNGAALLVTPGGSYRRVVIDHEGYALGAHFAGLGFTVFILFYRLPGDGWAAGPDVALSDAQRAIRIIRHRAGQYGIDPARIGALGFSAGGHLCADLATRFAVQCYAPVDAADTLSARPMIAAPLYPVITLSGEFAHAESRARLLGDNPSPAREVTHSPHRNVNAETPPCFLIHAEDDTAVAAENSLLLRAALKERGIPVELHLFAEGGHGFGIRRAAGKPAGAWPQLFVAWAQSRGLISAAG